MIKAALKNLLLTFSALGLFFIAAELTTKYFLKPSDLPKLQRQDRDGEVLRYVPNQVGTYRVKDEIAASFQINENGWNSRWPHYENEKDNTQGRICIIGDSYVEALQVDFGKSLAERLEDYLAPSSIQVYRFGLSGAALSHYLYMLRNEVSQYSPDMVIINLVHNDFIESINPIAPAVYDSSLSRLAFDEDGKISGVKSPKAYKPSWSARIKTLALFRYFWVRYQIRIQPIRDWWLRTVDGIANDEKLAGNIRVKDSEGVRVHSAIDYLFAELARFQSDHEVPILLVLDANRRFIQKSYKDAGNVDALVSLHEKVAKAALLHGLELLDLTEALKSDYFRYQIPFSFRNDGHWNEYAHSLVGEIVGARVITQHRYLFDEL